MAQLAKYLRFHRNADNKDYYACLYSTAAEANSSKLPVYVDGVGQAYAPVSGANPLPLYISDGAGTTYTVHQIAQVPYGNAMYNTAGTYTFTVPANVKTLRVTIVGGGGGEGVKYRTGKSAYITTLGGSGGNSSAFGYTSTGGTAGYIAASTDTENNTVGSGGTPNGLNGSHTSYYAKATATPNTNGGSGYVVQGVEYGYGGAKDLMRANLYVYQSLPIQSYGGGSGGRQTVLVNVTPATSYSIIVGGGGSSNTNGITAGSSNGGSGCVFVEWGGGI